MEFNHGVIYKPESLKKSVYTLEDADKAGAKYVCIYWVDLVNIWHCCLLPIKYFKDLIHSNCPSISVGNVSLRLIYSIMPLSFLPIVMIRACPIYFIFFSHP
ncbi:hypothetical protein MPER_08547 [Moniliophthora perniciosa FA553]|nr:hypothetical protein MPER_08547 [Moniliophthora perniciosa FA553]